MPTEYGHTIETAVGARTWFVVSIFVFLSQFLRRVGRGHRLESLLCTAMVMVTLGAKPPTGDG